MRFACHHKGNGTAFTTARDRTPSIWFTSRLVKTVRLDGQVLGTRRAWLLLPLLERGLLKAGRATANVLCAASARRENMHASKKGLFGRFIETSSGKWVAMAQGFPTVL